MNNEIHKYLRKEDWRIWENSNMSFSLQGMNQFLVGKIVSKFWLEEIYPNDVAEAHLSGWLHIHDLSNLSSYCVGLDLEDLIAVGFRGANDKVTSKPAKNLSALLGQIVNLTFTIAGEVAGAVAWGNFDTLLAPFVRENNIDYKELKQMLQEFIYNLNVPTRVGHQCVSEDTEILTKNGWKKYNEINVGDKILTLNIETKKIEEKEVLNVFVDEYSGKMFNIVNRDTNQLITPNHRVVRYVHSSDELILEEMKDVYKLKNFVIPKITNGQDGVVELSDSDKQYISRKNVKIVDYNGIIWCPTTENGTIIARRKGKVFITGNSPFSNLTFDLEPSPTLKDKAVVVGGKMLDYTYGECQKEMDMVNRAFCEVMLEGDGEGKIFSFPIPTYNITKDFNWDNPNLDLLWEMTAKYGYPYFTNYVNSDLSPEDARSFCCRLRIDTSEIKKRGGGLFGSSPLTGSIGVVTLNLPRMGYFAKDFDEFKKLIKRYMLLAKKSLEIKREFIEELTEKGLYPYCKFYFRNVKKRFGRYWDNHFNTIGYVGLNEAMLNLLGKDLTTKEGNEFGNKTLDYINEVLLEFQKETGQMFNLEATPAEGTSYRLAKKDKEMFPEIITAGNDEPYYTNSCHLPVGYTSDIFEMLELEDELQTKHSGGTVIHLYLPELVTKESIKVVLKKIFQVYRLPYISFTPTFSICETHGYLNGEQFKCPHCGKETLVYSRIVGFFRPIQNWNAGKKQEFIERKTYKIKEKGE